MTRYTVPARSQGKLYAQRAADHLERDTHRWVFVHGLAPDVESAVRHWLTIRLNGFYCDLHSAMQARTHIVLNNAPPPHTMAEAVEVDARGLNARDAAKALIKATGLNPHLAVCGWPFCLGELDGAQAEGGAA